MKSRPGRWRQILLAAVLACGAMALIGIIVVWGIGVYHSTFDSQHESTFLSFLANGQPVMVHFNFSQDYRQTFDLEGNPIEMNDETGSANPSALRANRPIRYSRRDQNWRNRILGFVDDQKPPNYWYLVHDNEAAGHAYFEGFSAATKRRVGYIGTAGFRQRPIEPDEQFFLQFGIAWNTSQVASSLGVYNVGRVPQNVDQTSNSRVFQPWRIFLNGNETIYEINLATRTVRKALENPRSVFRSLDFGAINDQSGGQSWLAIRDDETVRVLARDRETRVLPLADELRGRELSVVVRADGFTVVASNGIDHQKGLAHLRVYSAAADGSLSAPHDVDITHYSPESFTYEAPLVLGSPALLAGALLVYRPDELLELDMADSWETAAALAFRQYGLYLAVTIAAGVALAVSCYLRQARYQLSRVERIGWPLFVFLFGIPGWIGYRYCRRWPPLDVCPACHELAPHDQEVCAVCGHEFPLPEMKGTEIFA